MKKLIYFAHGNGFPSLSYKQFLSTLEPKFDYCYIDRIGHDICYPVTENWHFLVDEILTSIKDQANRPVIAVGHSLGGVLNLLAAIAEPDLFEAVIMLDSPLLGQLKSSMVRLAKALGVIDRITPAYKTKGRRQHWQTREELLGYLKSRPLFKTFDEQCILDYIDYGLEKKESGYYLRFDRHIEYLIYRTIPHVIPELQGQLKRPTALIYGDRSRVVSNSDRRYMEKKFGIPSFKIEGSHVFPFENPVMAANKVMDVLNFIGI